jgi:hypothetical protein
MSNIDKYYCIYKMNGKYNCVDTNLKTIDNINYHIPYDSNINRFDNYTLKKPNNYNISIKEDFINQLNMNNTNDNYPHTSIHPLHHEPNYNYPYTELEKFEKFDQNIDKEKIKERWNNVKKILQ